MNSPFATNGPEDVDELAGFVMPELFAVGGGAAGRHVFGESGAVEMAGDRGVVDVGQLRHCDRHTAAPPAAVMLLAPIIGAVEGGVAGFEASDTVAHEQQ